MTREEATKVLKAWNLNWSDEFTANEFEQAFTMAIKALSAEHCEEYISRAEVIDFVDNMPSELTSDGRRMVRQIRLKEFIADLPSVQPISVIEDIKAEIANMDGDINGYYVHKDDVLSVIDKYIRGEKG